MHRVLAVLERIQLSAELAVSRSPAKNTDRVEWLNERFGLKALIKPLMRGR
jgi:hypothetical protein